MNSTYGGEVRLVHITFSVLNFFGFFFSFCDRLESPAIMRVYPVTYRPEIFSGI